VSIYGSMAPLALTVYDAPELPHQSHISPR
jgi:hypothetical protein